MLSQTKKLKKHVKKSHQILSVFNMSSDLIESDDWVYDK